MDSFEENPVQHFVKEKREVLMLVLIFTVISSFFTLLFKNADLEPVINLAGALGYGFFILWWCKIDSAERDFNLSYRFSIMLVLFGAFALIYYLFKSRGLNGGLIGLLNASLLLFCIILINIFVALIYSIVFGIETAN